MSEQIRREFHLAFPLERVKQAIEDTCRTGGVTYQLRSKNEAFNSFSISIVKGVYILPATVSLSEISERETKFEISAIPGPNLTKMPTVTTAAIEGFLQKIGDFAAGKLIVQVPTPEQLLVQNRKAGKGLLLALLIAAAIIAYAIHVLYK